MMRVVILLLLLLLIASSARNLSAEVRKKQVCGFCKQFARQAFDYVAKNDTQTEVVEFLHSACAPLAPLKKQCVTLMDYYAPLFFLELSSVQPEDFCKKVNLCKEMAIISAEIKEDTCGICHRVMSEVLLKLKDPDAQLEIIELLLKGCNSMDSYALMVRIVLTILKMDSYALMCKKMVSKYGPVVLANAAQFLETRDLCIALHVCTSSITRTEATSLQLMADS